MIDQSNELRRFRAWAKKQQLDLRRNNMDRSEFMWSDTRLAWEAWKARGEFEDGWRNRVRISCG